MRSCIIDALNQAISPEYNYISFLNDFPGTPGQKEFYLSMALNHTPTNCLYWIEFFLKNPTTGIKIPQIQKIRFAYLLKTINDLSHNNLILINLKGEMKPAWEEHFGYSPPREDIRINLRILMEEAGFLIAISPIKDSTTHDFNQKFKDSAELFIKDLGEITQTPLFKDQEKDICILFMLSQLQFLKYCKALATTALTLNDLYFLWHIDLQWVKFCVTHIETLKLFSQKNISFDSLENLTRIDLKLFKRMLENGCSIISLMENHWVTIENIIDFSKTNMEACTTYLECASNLIHLKEAGIPFPVLITGDTHTNCHDTEIILSAIAARQQFEQLINHPKVIAEKMFFKRLAGIEMTHVDFFMSACVRSKIFRILIQNPEHVHLLVDKNLEWEQLCQNTEHLSAMLSDPNHLLTLLDQGIPFDLLIHWPIIPLSELLPLHAELLTLKKNGIDLNQLSALTAIYPKHALLILKNSENPHAKKWIKQQTIPPKIKTLPTLNKKYHVILDLDETLVSWVPHDLNAPWLLEFKKRGLYVEIPGGADGAPLAYILHPGVIELLNLLHKLGIKISAFSAGSQSRNGPLIVTIIQTAFFNSGKHFDICLASHACMQGSPYKNIKILVKTPDTLEQTILMDDNVQYRHPNQLTNFMHICGATSKTFSKIFNNHPKHIDKNLRRANHVFYMAGLCIKALKIAEKKGWSLSEALESLQQAKSTTTINNQPCILTQYETYYKKGLSYLQCINPTVQPVTKHKLFADGYVPRARFAMLAKTE